jgi:hypothetical protein
MVAHVCNLITLRLRQEDHEFEASLAYVVGPCLKKIKKEGRKEEENEGREGEREGGREGGRKEGRVIC